MRSSKLLFQHVLQIDDFSGGHVANVPVGRFRPMTFGFSDTLGNAEV